MYNAGALLVVAIIHDAVLQMHVASPSKPDSAWEPPALFAAVKAQILKLKGQSLESSACQHSTNVPTRMQHAQSV